MRLWYIFLNVNTVKIASWNVNSVRSRITNILDWLKIENPDILCLQETKVVDKDFPISSFEEIGYRFMGRKVIMVLLYYQNIL